MKASFVIPAYNAAGFIAETIESCLRQTEPDIEIVVVNDGSTDSTVKVVEYYAKKDKRVRLINLEKNVGRSEARNIGTKEAQSDIILVLDADDIAYPNRVKETLKVFDKKKDVSVVFAGFHPMDVLGQIYEPELAKDFDFERVKKDGFTYIGHSTMAYRKKVFDKVQYPGGDYCKHAIDDWKFQVDLHKAGFKFKAIPMILGSYRVIGKQRDEAKIKELKELCLA